MGQMGYLWILVCSQYTIPLLYIKEVPSPKVQPKIKADVEFGLGQGVTTLIIDKHTIKIETRRGRAH